MTAVDEQPTSDVWLNLPGVHTKIISSGFPYVAHGLMVDPLGRKLYWTNQNLGAFTQPTLTERESSRSSAAMDRFKGSSLDQPFPNRLAHFSARSRACSLWGEAFSSVLAARLTRSRETRSMLRPPPAARHKRFCATSARYACVNRQAMQNQRSLSDDADTTVRHMRWQRRSINFARPAMATMSTTCR